MSCPICENPFCEIVRKDGSSTTFDCAACGTYAVAQTALTTHLNGTRQELTPIKRAAISHLLREATDAGLKPLLTTYELDNWFANATLPSAAQQATNVIRLVGDHVSKTGMPLDTLPPDVCAIVGSPNQGFISRIMEQLIERKLLDGRKAHFGDWLEIDLTLDGWERYDAEKRGEVAGSYGFIALKFNDAVLDPFLQDVIKPAVADIGFTLEDMRDAAQAGVIDNVMRARIRDAAFVLVDLTHANEGAYWEAGYAEGLGKPVLYLCNRQVFNEQGTHFDTNHCTTVLWDPAAPDPFTEELKATLRRSLGLFAS